MQESKAYTCKTELLLYGWLDETKSLGVKQVDEVSEAAQEEDVPLVLSHAMGIQLAVHEQRLPLIQREPLHFWIRQGTIVVGEVPLRLIAVQDFDIIVFVGRHWMLRGSAGSIDVEEDG